MVGISSIERIYEFRMIRATNRKVEGTIPDEVIEFSSLPIHSSIRLHGVELN
jgi:hypothetical protein